MKITHATPVFEPAWQFGGPVKSIGRLCRALSQTEHEILVLSTNAGLPKEKFLGRQKRNGLTIVYHEADNKMNKNARTIYSKDFCREVEAELEGQDIVHLSAIWQPLGIAVQKAAQDLEIPVLHSTRGALSSYSFQQKWWKKYPYYWLYEKQWLNKAAGIHVTSQRELKEIEALQLETPCYLMSNPIDMRDLYYSEAIGKDWRRKNNISDNMPLLLICGRMHHKKGLDLLPQILCKLNDIQWHLLIVGNDEDGSGRELIDTIHKQGQAHRVSIHGNQGIKDLNAIYNASDILLLPSRHENFGNVVIEALACGCAVLTSEETGVSDDLVSDAPEGFGAVRPRNCQIWFEWLRKWLEVPRRAGKESAQWAEMRYSSSSVANRAIEIYEEILETGK